MLGHLQLILVRLSYSRIVTGLGVILGFLVCFAVAFFRHASFARSSVLTPPPQKKRK